MSKKAQKGKDREWEGEREARRERGEEEGELRGGDRRHRKFLTRRPAARKILGKG